MDTPNKRLTKEPEYIKIIMDVSGSKVTAHFPLNDNDPDIILAVQEMLISSYMDNAINTKNKKIKDSNEDE